MCASDSHIGYAPVAVFVKDPATVSFVSVTNGRSNQVAEASLMSEVSSVPCIFMVTVGVPPTASITSATQILLPAGDRLTEVWVLFPVEPRGAANIGPA